MNIEVHGEHVVGEREDTESGDALQRIRSSNGTMKT